MEIGVSFCRRGTNKDQFCRREGRNYVTKQIDNKGCFYLTANRDLERRLKEQAFDLVVEAIKSRKFGNDVVFVPGWATRGVKQLTKVGGGL